MINKLKKSDRFAANLKTLMKRWDFSNRKMAELLGMNASNVDTMRRSKTQPSVSTILRLEALTSVKAKDLYLAQLEFKHFPVQPILDPIVVAEEPVTDYKITKIPTTVVSVKGLFEQVESLTAQLKELRKDVNALQGSLSNMKKK